MQCCDYEHNNREWLSFYTDDMDHAAFDDRLTELVNPEEMGSYIELYCLSIIHDVEIIMYEQTSVWGIGVLMKIDIVSPKNTVKLL